MVQSPGLPLTEANQRIAEAVQGSSPEVLMDLLCRKAGPRPFGSWAMDVGARILAAEWRRLGAVDVHTDQVPGSYWDPGWRARLETTTPTQTPFNCLHHINTGAGSVEGPLLHAFDAQDVTRLGPALRGAVVLTAGYEAATVRQEPPQQHVIRLQEAGAAAVIMAGPHPDLPCIEFHFPGHPVAVPVVGVSLADGKRLAEMARSGGTRVRLKTAGRAIPVSCVNLIGDLGPDGKEPDLVILGAHLDSFHIAPGALDDLTGIVAQVEILRALAPFASQFTRRLRLIAYTGEEQGFVGSVHYIRSHAQDIHRTRFVLNLDTLWDSTALGLAVMWAPEMRDYVAAALQDSHPEVDARNFYCMSSDYLPFMLQGIAAARPADWRKSMPLWSHTAEDTGEKIPMEWIRSNTLVCTRLLLKVLTDPAPLPTKRKAAGEIDALLQGEDMEEYVRDWMDFGSGFDYLA